VQALRRVRQLLRIVDTIQRSGVTSQCML
jgi:hypothetical protein